MKLVLDKVSLPLAEFPLELDCEIESRLTCLVGASGSGKTSVLEVVAGLRRPRHGRIVLDGEKVFDEADGIWLPARKRRIGYVPQDLALFPHLSVRRNVLYGFNGERPDTKLVSICRLLEIETLLDRKPASLSGGQKQRVAFARAILAEPRLLLLDEPLSSLDQALKLRIFPYLRRVRDEVGIPMIYVTHAIDEVRELGDCIITMERGRLVDARAEPSGPEENVRE